jgi:ATP-dependent helicase/nuclease subunit B
MQRLLSGEDGFMSRPYPKYARSFGDYDHLARVREWALAAQGEGEGTGE